MKRILVAAGLLVCVFTSHAATGLSSLRYVADITVTLAGTVVGPNSVANDTLSGAPTLALSGLPGSVAAYYYTGSVHWLVFDTTVSLNGGTLTATPQDVVSYNGTTYSKIFTGASSGMPVGVMIDALSSTNGSDFLFSFDTSATVGSVAAAPEDVVRYSGGTWSSYFVGTPAGVPAGVNLDALYRLPNGHLLMSFDIAGTVGSVTFGAGDVLEYTAPSTWELAYSPAAIHPGWGAANLRGLWAQAAPLVPGTLQFSAPTYSVNETGGSVTITVTRTGGSSGAVTVHYATANGTATAGADYTTSTGTLSWPSGDTAAKTFAIPILTDALVEGNETVLLSLTSPTGGASLGTAAATLTIIDANLPAATPFVAANPNPLDFGGQTISVVSGTQNVVVTNTGSGNLNVASAVLGGTNSGDFVIVANSCGAAVAPGATCTLGLTFTPPATGSRVATLTIGSDAVDNSLVVNLAGTGVTTPAATAGGAMPVPTLSEWALILLNLMLACGVFAGMNRKETK
jgi:hypothetical protein